MEIIPLRGGQIIELSHPWGGPQSLDLHPRLRSIKITPAELETYLDVSTAKARLTAQAGEFGAQKLRDQLQQAKQEIATNITEEGLENVARLAALATDPAVARAVEREAHLAIEPELSRLDALLVPTCLRIIDECRAMLEKSAAKFSLNALTEFVADESLGQVASYVQDRIQASHRQLDDWVTKANNQGAELFLRDDAAVKIC